MSAIDGETQMLVNTMTGKVSESNLSVVKSNIQKIVRNGDPFPKFIGEIASVSLMETEMLNIADIFGSPANTNIPYGYGEFEDYNVITGTSSKRKLKDLHADTCLSVAIPEELIKYLYDNVKEVIRMLLPITAGDMIKPYTLSQLFAMAMMRSKIGSNHLCGMRETNNMMSLACTQWVRVGVDGINGMIFLPPIPHDMKKHVIFETFEVKKTINTKEVKKEVVYTPINIQTSSQFDEVDTVMNLGARITTLRKIERTSGIRKVLLSMLKQVYDSITIPVRPVGDIISVHHQSKKAKIDFAKITGTVCNPFEP